MSLILKESHRFMEDLKDALNTYKEVYYRIMCEAKSNSQAYQRRQREKLSYNLVYLYSSSISWAGIVL